MIKHDNKIKIPWYRKSGHPVVVEEMENKPLAANNNIGKPKTPKDGTRQPQEGVRVPVTVPSTVTAPSSVLSPNPFPFPFPKLEGGFNPNPNPFPPFMGNPANRIPSLPTPNPVPQPAFSEKDQNWINNFVKNVGYVAGITGISAKEIYKFVAAYDFANKGLKSFRNDAKDEFGVVAATILTVAILGKQLVGLWGRRATTMFSPPIILDDDFYKDNFGNDNIDA